VQPYAPTASITDTQAVIEWETNEDATSTVEFHDTGASSTDATFQHSVSLTGYRKEHSVTITGLNPFVSGDYGLYTFQVKSSDNATTPNTATAGPFTFETLADGSSDTTPPVITVGPDASPLDTQATITWTTDENSTTVVQFREGASGPPWTPQSIGNNVTDHSLLLSGLTPDTIHYYQVQSVDGSGNTVTSSVQNFTTAAEEDITGPDITGPTDSPSDTQATITWTTDELSTTIVQYREGTAAGPPWTTITDNTPTLNHAVTIIGLIDDTDYYYIVGSIDISPNANDTYSSGAIFHTALDSTKPVIQGTPTVTTTDTKVTFNWVTDEASTSFVDYDKPVPLDAPYDTASSPGLTTSHTVTITKLPPGTEYAYQLRFADALNNEDTYAGTFTTDDDDIKPWVEDYPVINPGNTIDIIFSEQMNIQNATNESNYTFSDPSLNFENGITFIAASNTYRLSMASIPAFTILTLLLEDLLEDPITPITDLANNIVEPTKNPVTINDNDEDGMADDWEISIWGNLDHLAGSDEDSDGLTNRQEFEGVNGFSRTDPRGTDLDLDGIPDGWDSDGDGMPDGWEATQELDPNDDGTTDPIKQGADGDWDSDGWKNLEEYNAQTVPNDAGSKPDNDAPVIEETIPDDQDGIVSQSIKMPLPLRVPYNVSFGVRITDDIGIDLTDNNSIIFTIDDGVNPAYDKNLGAAEVRYIKLTSSEPNDYVTSLWVVYDRSQDAGNGNAYAFSTDSNFAIDPSSVTIRTVVTDRNGLTDTYDAEFKIETAAASSTAAANKPDTGISTIVDSNYTTPMEISIFDIDSDLNTANIVYDNSEPVTPFFGSSNEIPEFDYTDVDGVGAAMNLQPLTVFNTPVKIFIPCPEYDTVDDLSVYLYNGSSWVLAMDADDNVQPDGQGWVVPGSRVDHNNGSPSTIEIQVYHFTGAQAGSPSSPSSPPPSSASGDSSSGCFIATAAYGSNFEKHVQILQRFRDVYMIPSKIGQAFVNAYCRYSPPVANYIADRDTLRTMVRWILLPVVGLSYMALHVGMAPTLLLMMGLLMVLLAMGHRFILTANKRGWT